MAMTKIIPKSERYFCATHGDLSNGTDDCGGMRLQPYMKKGDLICPYCYCDWLRASFPVGKGKPPPDPWRAFKNTGK